MKIWRKLLDNSHLWQTKFKKLEHLKYLGSQPELKISIISAKEFCLKEMVFKRLIIQVLETQNTRREEQWLHKLPLITELMIHIFQISSIPRTKSESGNIAIQNLRDCWPQTRARRLTKQFKKWNKMLKALAQTQFLNSTQFLSFWQRRQAGDWSQLVGYWPKENS